METMATRVSRQEWAAPPTPGEEHAWRGLKSPGLGSWGYSELFHGLCGGRGEEGPRRRAQLFPPLAHGLLEQTKGAPLLCLRRPGEGQGRDMPAGDEGTVCSRAQDPATLTTRHGAGAPRRGWHRHPFLVSGWLNGWSSPGGRARGPVFRHCNPLCAEQLS